MFAIPRVRHILDVPFSGLRINPLNRKSIDWSGEPLCIKVREHGNEI